VEEVECDPAQLVELARGLETSANVSASSLPNLSASNISMESCADGLDVNVQPLAGTLITPPSKVADAKNTESEDGK